MKDMKEPVSRELKTVAEAGDFLRVSRPKIYKMMKSGELKFIKLGARTLIRQVDLDNLIARLAGETA